MENRQTIFISYSSKDKAIATALCAHLEKAQLKCWIAPRDIAPGKDYAASIIEAINHSAIMILVFSQHSNDSDHVRNEVERAFNKRIEIIPFRISDTMPSAAMEYFLSLKHWLDAFEKKPVLYFNEVQKICERLLDHTLDATTAVENSYVLQTAAAKNNKPLLYGLGILAVLLVGYFMWNVNARKMESVAQSDSIANLQNQMMQRQRDSMKILEEKLLKNVDIVQSQPPQTPNPPKKEPNLRFAISLDDHAAFNSPTKSDYLNFDKSNANTYDFVGKISNTPISGTAKQVGDSKYKIVNSTTIQGHFNVNGNEITGDVVLLENNQVPRNFIVYKSE